MDERSHRVAVGLLVAVLSLSCANPIGLLGDAASLQDGLTETDTKIVGVDGDTVLFAKFESVRLGVMLSADVANEAVGSLDIVRVDAVSLASELVAEALPVHSALYPLVDIFDFVIADSIWLVWLDDDFRVHSRGLTDSGVDRVLYDANKPNAGGVSELNDTGWGMKLGIYDGSIVLRRGETLLSMDLATGAERGIETSQPIAEKDRTVLGDGVVAIVRPVEPPGWVEVTFVDLATGDETVASTPTYPLGGAAIVGERAYWLETWRKDGVGHTRVRTIDRQEQQFATIFEFDESTVDANVQDVSVSIAAAGPAGVLIKTRLEYSAGSRGSEVRFDLYRPDGSALHVFDYESRLLQTYSSEAVVTQNWVILRHPTEGTYMRIDARTGEPVQFDPFGS